MFNDTICTCAACAVEVDCVAAAAVVSATVCVFTEMAAVVAGAVFTVLEAAVVVEVAL